MRQSQFRSALGSAFVGLDIQCLETSHRLAGLRRDLEAQAAALPLADRFGGLPAVPVLLALAGVILLFS